MQSITDYLRPNPYPGRGIMLGLTPDGKQAVLAYFIMGRSENSRNRVFVNDTLKLKTQAHDPDKLSDPSLVIYTALRVCENQLIITNGDQTDTIYQELAQGGSFEQALRSRVYEPDQPNFTPRISGLISIISGQLHYKLSILKKGGNEGCLRFFYEYGQPQPGFGHIIHTYRDDGNPLPSFAGEPVCLPTSNDISEFARGLWAALDEDNRVALHVRYISLEKYPVMSSYTCDRFGGQELK